MNVSGPVPLTPLPRTDDTSLALRLNQRLAAEVLKVAGDRVTLALDGVQVVARMTSSEQAAALSERRLAQFIVKDLSGPLVTLQLVGKGDGKEAQSPSRTDLVQNLLRAAGLPGDAATLAAARALIHAGLPVTQELLGEIRRALKALNGKGTESPEKLDGEARLAAALKAAGLPLSPEILKLLDARQEALPGLLGELRAGLEALLRRAPEPEIEAQARAVLQMLDSLLLKWDGEPSELAEALRQAVRLLGSSLERGLAEGEAAAPEELPGLLALAKLRTLLDGKGDEPLLDSLDRFLDRARALQLLNAETEKGPEERGWLRLEVAFARAPGEVADPRAGAAARLKIARSPDGYACPVDPGKTRLVLLVDLEDGETVQVDLSVVEHRVGVQVLASSEALLERAEAEKPGLEAGLQKLGFTLQSASFALGIPDREDPFDPGLRPRPPVRRESGNILLEV